MILPQAAVASPASLSVPGSARASSGKASVASGVEFQTLLQSTVARTSMAIARPGALVPSNAGVAANAADADALSDAEQNQGSAASPSTDSGQQSAISVFLAFGGMAPLQTLSTNVTLTNSSSSDANSEPQEQTSVNATDAQTTEPTIATEELSLPSIPAQLANPNINTPAYKKVSTTALVSNTATAVSVFQVASAYGLAPSPAQVTAAESTAKGTPAAAATNVPQAPIAGDAGIQPTASPSAPVSTIAAHPVFALEIRASTGTQQQSASEQPPSIQPPPQAIQQSLVVANPVTPAPNLQVADVRLPLNAANGHAQDQPSIDLNSTSTTSNSAQGTAGDTLGEDTAAAAPAASGSPITVRPDALLLDSDPKSSSIQTSDKLSMAPILETVTPALSSSNNPTSASPAPRSGSDYAHADEPLNAPGSAPVTDIRLQLDGAANQQVSVRLVQQADGLRVTVRSNDPELTQALQERVPELTMRLDQHHYQTEVLLPERADPQHFTQTNSNTNSQQDSSGRNQSSSGQGNPGNKQNQQQKQQTWDEEDFATLLA